VVDESGAEALRSMAGLRSLLVHAYAAVDRGKVMEFSRSLQLDAPRLAYIMLKRAGEASLDPEGSVEEGLRGVVEALSKVFKGRVRAAYLYGGGVKGYSLKGDYDVAVLMPEGYALYDLGGLQVDAAEALQVGEESVDILCLNSAPPRLILQALSGLPIIEEDSAEVLELKARALRELLDLEAGLRAVDEALKPRPRL